MSVLQRFLLLTAATAVTSFASTISFGPGLPNTTSPSTIIGSPLDYKVFGVQLSQPTMSDPDWQLTIETNYGFNDLPEGGGQPTNIPNGATSIPTFSVGGVPYNIGDFLITQGINDYGVLLFPHDTYTPSEVGSLFQVTGFQLTQDLLPTSARHDNIPVEIAPGGTDLSPSGGTLTVTVNPDTAAVVAGTEALYTITVNFSAPTGFLDETPFTVDFSSAICANDYLIGTGQFPPVGPIVPEPGTWVLMASGLLLLGFGLSRRKVS